MSVLVAGSKCSLCDKVFRGPEEELGGAMILGEQPKQRVARYIGRLIEHLHKHHPEQMAYYAAQQAEYFGLICLMTFDTSDEAVRVERDYLRWTIHNATRRAKVTNERIREKTKACVDAILKDLDLELSQNVRVGIVEEKISAMLMLMRDVLEETNAYPAHVPPATAINTAPSPSTQAN